LQNFLIVRAASHLKVNLRPVEESEPKPDGYCILKHGKRPVERSLNLEEARDGLFQWFERDSHD
jgi:hypothetical protein